ncbi:S8 family peptidase [Pseudoxanthomonas putridarboris]|uniref:S8 family peptidase n=2 Tax=Pseudoxanthomonas putridarboris TaxID=752605 RepID=A0ABU9J5Y7_9GAMM
MKEKMGLMVAGGLAMAVAGTATVSAAGPASGALAPLRTVPAASASDAGARIVVRYRAGTAAAHDIGSKVNVVQAAAQRANPVVAPLSGSSVGGSLRGGAQPLQATHLRKLAVGADVIRLSRSLDASEMNNLLVELKADPSVEYAEIDRRMYPLLTPNDAWYASHQWNFHNATGGIRMPEAWDVSTGAGTVVAVLDTGVLPANPDLGANLLEGYDFITDAWTSRRATDDRVPGALDQGDWNPVANECYSGSPAMDSSWHGTHVAGTVAQVTNNAVGVAGVAFDAKVLPVRVLGRCGGYTSDIVDAIVWASGGTVGGVPANANPAEVINLSLGGSGACSATYQSAINTAVANGSVVVVAAGNSNANASGYSPASCNNVISVGATRITGGKASYSNYGAAVDLSAPGGGAYTADPGNDGWDGYVTQIAYDGATTPTSGTGWIYLGYVGTSMASPHVAAAAALVQSALVADGKDPLTPAALETLLKTTARPFPVSIPGSTPMGTGILNAKAALDKALDEQEPGGLEAIELVNKVNVTGLSSGGEEALYRFEATAGSVLTFLTSGGTGDVSLYARFGAEPSVGNHDARSERPGNSETIRFTAPQAGTYYLKLTGSYAGLTLVARQ